MWHSWQSLMGFPKAHWEFSVVVGTIINLQPLFFVIQLIMLLHFIADIEYEWDIMLV